MPFDPQEVKALGTKISRADRDAFGVKTDGKGHVPTAKGSHPLTAILAVERKYIVFANPDHATLEQVFDDALAAEMKAAGITLMFDEGASAEYIQIAEAAYQKVMKQHPEFRPSAAIPLTGSYAPQHLYALQSYAALKTAHIQPVACDARKRQDKSESAARIDKTRDDHKLRNTVDPWMDVMVQAALKAQDDVQADQQVTAILREYIGPALLKTDKQAENTRAFADLTDLLIHDQENALRKALLTHPADAQPCQAIRWNLDILQRVKKEVPHEPALNDVIPPRQTLNLNRNEVLLLHNMVQSFVKNPAMVAQAKASAAVIDRQTISTDSLTAETIRNQSATQEKVAIRWGFGHFDGRRPNNLRDCLGTNDTLVILTVATREEMQEELARLFLHPTKQMPEYVYMPAYSENGRRIESQVVSVAEYVAAEKALADRNLRAQPPKPVQTR